MWKMSFVKVETVHNKISIYCRNIRIKGNEV